jgi:hypothetical protein
MDGFVIAPIFSIELVCLIDAFFVEEGATIRSGSS